MGLLGSRIRELRQQKGVTQDELAQLIGTVSRNYVAQVEAGVRTPSWAFVLGLRRALGVSIDDLIDSTQSDPQVNVL